LKNAKTRKRAVSLTRAAPGDELEQGGTVGTAGVLSRQAALDAFEQPEDGGRQIGILTSSGRGGMEEGKFHVFCISSWHTLDNVHYQKSDLTF
jgi:hypothetical protein